MRLLERALLSRRKKSYTFFRPQVESLEERTLLAGTGIWPIAPVANDHELRAGFGEYDPAPAVIPFHPGIDILVDGRGGQVVRAARSGKLIWNNPAYAGGMITIAVTLANGTVEYDRYLHVGNIVAPAENAVNPPNVAQGV